MNSSEQYYDPLLAPYGDEKTLPLLNKIHHIGYVILGIQFLLMPLFLINKSGNDLENIKSMWMFLLFFIILSIFIANGLRKIRNLSLMMQNLDRLLITISTTEEILRGGENAEKLYKTYLKLIKCKDDIFIKCVDVFINRRITAYFQESLNRIFSLLKQIQSELNKKVHEQKQILESAKSEVEKHIGSKNELEQVSEIQKARLDRQIEQFKELQKVLVKL